MLNINQLPNIVENTLAKASPVRLVLVTNPKLSDCYFRVDANGKTVLTGSDLGVHVEKYNEQVKLYQRGL